MKRTKRDEFGFLFKKCNLKFDGIEILQLDSYDKDKNFINEHVGREEFYYPPVKSSELMHRLPASHQIIIKSDKKTCELRLSETGFLINLIGYLFGCRLQFSDWWVDSRVPVRSNHNVSFTIKVAEEFLGHAFSRWKRYSKENQELFTSLLFMHSRNSSYWWDWERFMMEYAVLDGFLRIYFHDKKVKKGIRQNERIGHMFDDFGMKIHKDKIDRIVDLRNNLMHKALWDNKQPGTHAKEDAFHSPNWLKKINQRLIPALLNYNTNYIKSDWALLGTFIF